ncbi:hypothetical protein E3N88_42456 [Mikania micrantha]|uniref:Ty3 transposon capsid-like protein domain-containing protein n=1 Tax=Mikania micrantha TaxID=192012 RepID=A0A5N6LHU4_9ASTR|nr:hypothetical protein E3N88_42456 [Mikania micrantha]
MIVAIGGTTDRGMTTRNQSIDQRVHEHEQSLLRLESAAGKQANELEAIRTAAAKNAENMVSMKEQLEAQMNQILQSLQSIGNNSHSPHNSDSTHNGFGSSNYNGSNCTRFTKMEFPKFNGENVEGWLYKVEHFFMIDSTPEHLKVRYAIVHLEDMALLWHQSFVQSRGGTIEEMGWVEYKKFITLRFAEVLGQDAMGSLANLKQTGNLKEFCKQFDLALTKVTICDEYAVSIFLRAVKPEIGYPLRLLRPKNLPEAYLLARIQEEAVSNLGSSKYNKGINNGFSSSHMYSSRSNQAAITNKASNLPLLPAPPIKAKPVNARRLSHKEIEEKRANGECFGCTEKYSPGHQCKNKQLFSIELIDVEDDVSQLVDEVSDQGEFKPFISLNVIMGVPSFSTMRIRRSVGTKPLQILIDSGSTHNFLDLDLAIKMHCPMKEVEELNVTVADGNKMPCNRLCENFKWMMQNNWFTADVMLVPLTNYDMILGVQWLQSLNDIVWNFKDLTMKFKVGQQIFELKGIGSNTKSLCSANKMNHLLQGGSSLASIHLFSLQLASSTGFQHETVVGNIQVNAALQVLLDKYADVFAVPEYLPPKRDCDHRVILKDENVSINQRAYRYPAAQKNVLEQLTQELLDSGVIRDSKSTFASPVVLVKKKTWRFCVDYRQLNAATVKNRFPIPLIEELLEELGGATVFSKVDLRAGYHQSVADATDSRLGPYKAILGNIRPPCTQGGVINLSNTRCVQQGNSLWLPVKARNNCELDQRQHNPRHATRTVGECGEELHDDLPIRRLEGHIEEPSPRSLLADPSLDARS